MFQLSTRIFFYYIAACWLFFVQFLFLLCCPFSFARTFLYSDLGIKGKNACLKNVVVFRIQICIFAALNKFTTLHHISATYKGNDICFSFSIFIFPICQLRTSDVKICNSRRKLLRAKKKKKTGM